MASAAGRRTCASAHSACREHGVAIDAAFGPGAHEWGYWDAQIRTILDRLPLKNQGCAEGQD